jgi:hypothetical protein
MEVMNSKTINRKDTIQSIETHLRIYRDEAKMAKAKGIKDYARDCRNVVKGLKMALGIVKRINGTVI